MNEDDITLTQAAELLGITRPSLHQLLTRGVLTSRRLGHLHVLSHTEVLAYQASRAGRHRPGPARGTPRPRRDQADQGEATRA